MSPDDMAQKGVSIRYDVGNRMEVLPRIVV
jgi:hypothetical protein